MSKVKSPVLKKRLAYKRDHFSAGEYPHQFRVCWPKKEKAAGRAYRRSVGQRLAAALLLDGKAAAETDVRDIRRRVVRKWPASTLREKVARKLDRRVRSVNAKTQRRASHAQFQSFLEQIHKPKK